MFAHIPKTAGVYLAGYFTAHLKYRRILSQKESENGVWRDFTLDEVMQYVHYEDDKDVFFHTHTLSYGWNELAPIIPWASKEEIITAIRAFKDNRWFTFAFVRHPGEILCSFYHYVYDFHNKGEPKLLAAHSPVVDRTIDTFVSEHCEKELLPSYWEEYDFVAEASDSKFSLFFERYFDHDFQAGKAPSHASGSLGYAYYCVQGAISKETQIKVERSLNMRIYQAITGKWNGV